MTGVFNRLYNVLLNICSKFSKVIFHYFTGQGEIERICSKGYHHSEMSFQFAKSLKQSKQLSTFSTIIFFPKPFAVKPAFDAIVAIKRVEVPVISSNKSKPQSKICSMNINCCLVALRHVNLVINNLEKSQKIVVIKSDPKYRSLMADFLSNMLGTDVVNSQDPAYEFNGGGIGFQGKVFLLVINVFPTCIHLRIMKM